MLLATFICPVEELDAVRVEEWVDNVVTLELAENLSRNLLCRLPYIGIKSMIWVQSENYWKCAIGFFCAAFGLNYLSQEQKYEILGLVKQNKHINEVPTFKGIALFLRKLGGQSKDAAMEVLSFVDCFAVSANKAERYIAEEVKTDLIYRFDI